MIIESLINIYWGRVFRNSTSKISKQQKVFLAKGKKTSKSNKVVLRFIVLKKQSMVETFVLMWVDASVNSSDGDNLRARETLAKIYSQFNTFESVDQCEIALRQLPPTNRAILIVSGRFGEALLPRIHELQQVSTIYVFCFDREKYVKWAEQF